MCTSRRWCVEVVGGVWKLQVVCGSRRWFVITNPPPHPPTSHIYPPHDTTPPTPLHSIPPTPPTYFPNHSQHSRGWWVEVVGGVWKSWVVYGSRRWCMEVVGRVRNLFVFVRGISGIVGWFCGLADPPKKMRFMIVSDNSEQV